MSDEKLKEMIKSNLQRKSGCKEFELHVTDTSLEIIFDVQGFYCNEEDQKVSFETSIFHGEEEHTLDSPFDMYVRTKPNPEHGDVLLSFNFEQMKLLREYLDLRIKQVEKAKS